MKNTVALAVDDRIVLSQHIGDLETAEARRLFQQTLKDLPRLYDSPPEHVVCDLHPDYPSTSAAEEMHLPICRVQHHQAHIRACMVEHGLTGNVLGVAWDGTGYGPDGTVWGGEFLHVREAECRRVAFLRPFRLPGGEKAIREPRRAALGVLYELLGDAVFQQNDLAPIGHLKKNEIPVLSTMLHKGIQAPQTSSISRLFDAVASLSGLRQVSRFEGQAAMELQFAWDGEACGTNYPLTVRPDGMIDWEPMVREIVADLREPARISAKFHGALADVIVEIARSVGEPRVVLGGGCFQNRLLLEHSVHRLRSAGFDPYWPQRVPPNDGGLALGQIAAWSSSE